MSLGRWAYYFFLQKLHKLCLHDYWYHALESFTEFDLVRLLLEQCVQNDLLQEVAVFSPTWLHNIFTIHLFVLYYWLKGYL